MTLLIVLLSLLFGAIRFLFHRQVAHGLDWPGTYEAFAHIWIGVLLGLAVFRKDRRKEALWALLILSVAVEGVMFLVDNPGYWPK